MSQFAVSAWDINVNTKITDLKVTGLKFGIRMNDAGPFGFSVNLSDQSAQKLAYQLMSNGNGSFKVLITVNNGTLIVYSGIMFQPNMKAISPFIDYAGKALSGWFTQVVIADSYTTSVSPPDLIAQAIVDAQAVGPGADRAITPVVVGTNPPPDVTPSYNINQYTTVAQVMSDMTAGITPGTGGVDYYMVDGFDANLTPTHTLNIITPRCGRDQSVSGLSVNLKKALDWTWPTDSTQSGSHVIVVGSGTGGAQPVAYADADGPHGGLGQPPRSDIVLQYSQVSEQDQLQNIANGAASQYGHPIETPTVKIPIDYPPCRFGEFQIGDDIRVWSEPSLHFPNGLSRWLRIVAYDVEVPDAGLATVTLTLNPPPVF